MPESSPVHLLPLLHRTLGDNPLATYLHGSATLAGGLRPHSDLDFLVVVRRRTTHDERRALVRELLTRPLGHRPVELIVVRQSDIRPWRYPPTCEFLYGEWLRDDFERGMVPAPEPSPDLAPLLTMALRGNAALFGPPPAVLLDPVPPADLRRAIVEGVPQLVADLDHDTRNVLLTLARVWTTLATGDIRSKDQAADWVLPHLPAEHRPVLARARAVYLGDEHERWDDLTPHLRPCVDQLLAGIEENTQGSRQTE